MARLIYTPSGGGGPVGPFEPLVLETLRLALPKGWGLAPNFQIKQHGRDALEYDIVRACFLTRSSGPASETERREPRRGSQAA